MSKRHRFKKKKKLKLQKKISEIAAPQSGVEIEAMPVGIEEVPPTEQTAKTPVEKPVEEKESKSIIDAPTRKFISRDVRMILFTLLGLAIVLTIVKILALKTGVVNAFGDWLYKITNIQTM